MCHLPCMRWTLNPCVCSLNCRWCCTLQESCVRSGRTLCHQTPAQEYRRTPLKKRTPLFTRSGRERTEKESESATESLWQRQKQRQRGGDRVQTTIKKCIPSILFADKSSTQDILSLLFFFILLWPRASPSSSFIVFFFNRMLHRLSRKEQTKQQTSHSCLTCIGYADEQLTGLAVHA